MYVCMSTDVNTSTHTLTHTHTQILDCAAEKMS